MTIERNKAGYVEGADGEIARTVLGIGQRTFPQSLLTALRRIADVDHCMVFAFQNFNSARCLLNVGNIPIGSHLGEAYSGQFHQSDPNKEAIFELKRDVTPILLPPFERRMYTRNYRKIFFDDADIVDKFATAIWLEDACFYINFYRVSRRGAFSALQVNQLRRVSPSISAAIAQHFKQVPQSGRVSSCSSLQGLFQTNPAFQHLTSREAEVCLRILLGYSSEAISDHLGISIHSTITYRKRAYQKLGISSQNELFSIILQSLIAVGDETVQSRRGNPPRTAH